MDDQQAQFTEAEQAAVDEHNAKVQEILHPEPEDGLTPQERAERDAHLVRSSDDLTRAAAGIETPEDGHDVRDYRPEIYETLKAEGPEPIDREALKAELLAEIRGELNTGK